MDFGFASVERTRIIYTHDDDVDKVLHVRVFPSHKQLHHWMAQNKDKTIQRMTIQYTYPDV